MLAQLKSAGVKEAEIQATGLDKLLSDPSVKGFPITRDEIVKHLEENRIQVRETQYGGRRGRDTIRSMSQMEDRLAEIEASPELMRTNADEHARLLEQYNLGLRDYQEKVDLDPRWASNSLDPSNPTYRETVLHLPASRTIEEFAAAKGMKITPETRRIVEASYGMDGERDFKSGHFPEPNIIGHMMTSETKHPTTGGKVYTIDQIQSDWGQKLRDGGVRDEAKIAELKEQQAILRREMDAIPLDDTPELNAKADAIDKQLRLLHAELNTATTSAPGHPLVNTTDQWTNTTLRRALKQAVDSNADHIAIPSGDTVLSYNPGDSAGMNTFYGKIVPKNLNNIMRKYDPAYPGFNTLPELETTQGLKGNGFSMFPLTDKVREAVRSGQPLFANAETASPLGLLSQGGKDKGMSDLVRQYGWASAAAMLGMSVDDLQAQNPVPRSSNPLYSR
jgi:hypothetical protein